MYVLFAAAMLQLSSDRIVSVYFTYDGTQITEIKRAVLVHGSADREGIPENNKVTLDNVAIRIRFKSKIAFKVHATIKTTAASCSVTLSFCHEIRIQPLGSE